MPDSRTSELVRFGPFELDLATAELHRSGRKIRLPEQQFKILVMLLHAEGNLVSREEIRKQLWPNDTVVEFDRSINAAVKKLRAALDDSAEAPRFIETVARRGYRILIAVHFPEAAPGPGTVGKNVDGSLAGRKVSHYRILTLLGGGGMGLVYKAEDLKLNRPVALKFLPEELASDSLAIQRFEREAKAASALNHPNICTIYGVEEYGPQPFMAMELLEGESLRELIAEHGPHDGSGTSHLPLPKILDIAIQIATGLEAAHEKGIVHRDIKPANIFVTRRGQVKILDFGLAKVAEAAAGYPEMDRPEPVAVLRRDSPADHLLTRTGITMGTAAYMSPEQVRGEKLDARTDLFSFGLVLFEMATGKRAFCGDTAASVQDAILHRSVPGLRQLAPEMPAELETIIAKALEKDREQRYQSAAGMLEELKRTLKAIQAMSPPASLEASPIAGDLSLSDRRAAPSRWALRGGTFAGAVLLLAAFIFLWWKISQPSARAEIKERQLTTSSSDNPITGAAISGDGKYLAFEDNSGLHVRSLETGETSSIPNPPQFGDMHVFWRIRWLPDSTRFLAVSRAFFEGHAITWEASVMGGTLRKIREDVEAQSVSPDGSSIAATLPDEHELRFMRELWVMDTDGGNARKLLDAGEQTNVENVRWSPDGRKLLYLRIDENSVRRSVEIRDLKSGDSHVVLSDPQLRDLYWLRDGRVVYVRADKDFPTNGESCNYWVARIDERTNTFASQPVQLTHNRGFCMVDTSATADSKRLVFTKRSEDEGVYVADVEAGGTRITPPRHLSMIQGVEFPNGWTPDSREVLYTSNRDEGWGIYRQPVSGGSAQPVLVEKTAGRRADFGFPRLSPDGGWLLIERPSPGSTLGIHNDLLRVPVSGGPEQLIASDIWGIPNCAAPPIPICAYSKKENNQIIFIGFDPRFKQKRELGRFTFIDPKAFYGGMLSPDATQIVISRPAAGDIYLLNLQTKALRKIIVKNWTNFVSMDWTADGKGLFVSALQPAGVLLHIDLHGNAQVLWQPGGEQPVWALPSPDGKHVAMPADSVNLNVWMMENF